MRLKLQLKKEGANTNEIKFQTEKTEKQSILLRTDSQTERTSVWSEGFSADGFNIETNDRSSRMYAEDVEDK